MKKKIFVNAVLCCLALLCGEVKAENTDLTKLRYAIYVDSEKIPQGTTEYVLSIKMKNEVESKGFSFELSLPEGISIATNNGKPDVQLSNVRTSSEHIDYFYPQIIGDNLKVVAYGNKGDGKITGNDGEIALVRILLSENISPGDYTIIVKNLAITLDDENNNDAITELYGGPIEVSTTLTIEEAPASFVTFDENSDNAEALVDATGVDVKVKRTIKAGQWNTICLPFAMTEAQVRTAFGDDVELGDFIGCEATYDETEENIIALKVNFSPITDIEPNHPYLIKVSTDIEQFEVDAVDVIPSTDLSVNRDEWRHRKYGTSGPWVYDYDSFIGTYKVNTDIPEFALFLNNNKFWYSTGLTKSKAFRGYFSFYQILSDVTNAESRINMSLFKDETTGVSEIGDREFETENTVYDLSGRKIKSQLKKGIYIENGKKKIVK